MKRRHAYPCTPCLCVRGVDFPTTQSLLNYVLLSLFTFRVARRSNAARTHEEKTGPTGNRSQWPLYRLHVPWWQYLLLAIADVEANYLLVLAYQYTTITSVQLLDCFTIPCVMILSRVILHVTYSWQHVAGALVCVCGLSLLVVSDVIGHRFGDSNHDASDRVIGDILVLVGAFLYALSNLGQEYILKSVSSSTASCTASSASNDNEEDRDQLLHEKTALSDDSAVRDHSPLLPTHDDPSPTSYSTSDAAVDAGDASGPPNMHGASRSESAETEVVVSGADMRPRFESNDEARYEYLSQLGLFGTLVSTIQMIILERHRWSGAHKDIVTLLYVIGYTACIFTLYVGTSALLQRSSALVMNLSFLTADFYAVIMALLIFNAHLNVLYFIAFTVIIGGLLMYHTAPERHITTHAGTHSHSSG